MNRRSARNHLLLFILVFMLILTSAFSLPETAQAAPIAPPEEFERVRPVWGAQRLRLAFRGVPSRAHQQFLSALFLLPG